MEMNDLLRLAVLLALIGISQAVQAVAPSPREMETSRRWIAAKFQGIVESPKIEPGLVVLANHDVVQRNARAGKPLKIGEAQYERGLYCHAVSRVVVQLPSPGKTFSAVVGVDHNDQTSGGRGSLVFSVDVGGKEAFRSEVMHGGGPGVSLTVDLHGESRFTLDISDAGDGISCDQADWADAKVFLQDGSMVWLGDMAIIQGQAGLPTADPPFSFMYGGKLSAELLDSWKVGRTSKKVSNGTEYSTTYDDPKTGLEVRCVALAYSDFPTVEWTVYFKNAGKEDTPILSDVMALDASFARKAEGDFILHHHYGTLVKANDYQPFDAQLKPGVTHRFAPPGGRPCGGCFPYFNLELGGEGVIIVVGWPGEWMGRFEPDDKGNVQVRAGQELVHLKLHPGEEIRTPLMVLQFWQGDRLKSQNVWRRWMIEHNLPRPGGKLPSPQMTPCSSHQFGEMVNADEASQKLFIDRYLEEGLKIDYWWMDAGWYVNETGWPNTGTWEVDKKRFPNGLRAITDYGHSKGVKSIVWFEPERVTPGTWLYQNHPEWLLGKDGDQKLLNLGNPEARQWLTNHIDRLITEQGIDLYRQDFNIDPLGFWRAADSEDRKGITENAYVTGYLAYWDELRRRHPNMLIDTCASGGHRNDLETLRRAVPLLRSDYIFEPIGQQCHTYALSLWFPYYGTGMISTDPYVFRSAMAPGIIPCWDVRDKSLPYDLLRKLTSQWRGVANYFLGDYYPLTSYSLENDVWMAFQFDRPEIGEGVVLAFRRPESVYESARFKLQGLDAEAKYSIKNLDAGDAVTISGKELCEKGLQVALKNQPDSAVIVYKKVN